MAATREPADFAHSLTDLMAGVAAIFLLIAVVFILMAAKREERETVERQKYEEQIRELEKFRQSVLVSLDSLRQALLADSSLSDLVAVDDEARKRDPFLFVVVFNRRRLSFPPRKCALSDEQVRIVEAAAPRVLSHVCRFAAETGAMGGASARRASVSMTLEGHTDRHPFLPGAPGCGVDKVGCTSPKSEKCSRAGFENNVRLSAARAQSVFFAMERVVANDQRLAACLEKHFVVAGRGPVEPVDGRPWRSEHTDEEDELNRRVILKIRAQPSLDGIGRLARAGSGS